MSDDLRGLHLHFDAPSGAAGDMALGALLDLGVPEAVVRETLAKLPVTGYELTASKAVRRGLVGTDVRVLIQPENAHEHEHEHGPDQAHAHDHDHDHGHDHAHGHLHGHVHGPPRPRGTHAHRHYGAIRALIQDHLEGPTLDLSLAIFDRIARAESKLHGVPPADVAFHEVGAIDSIVDIVATAAALAWLRPAGVSATPPAVGHGTVAAAHGLLPVPAPATLEIAREAGMPIVDGGLARELCTPTGAAILATVVTTWGPAPPLAVRAVGYGAGDADFPDRANLLRATLGAPIAAPAAEDTLVELCANLDDMNPELCDHVAERLFDAGALDVWWTPVLMKKSRPAVVLGVLGPDATREDLIGVILAETTTLGVRHHPVSRTALDRRSVVVDTGYGPISVKIGERDGRIMNAAPEHDSCRAAARAHGVPLKEVYAAAMAAFRRML